jgi:TRAP-type C4-dicarboxylate transport system substrate-binding protein
MHTMKRQGRLALLASIVVTTVLATSCAGDTGGSGDKAGGAGEPVVLQMANFHAGLDQLPAVAHFVDRVEELSGGEVRIEVIDAWGDFAPGVEQQLVQSVSAGEVDLGWVGTRVFDTLGVKSFQALTAPMLIDSYALQDAVIRSGITEEMVTALDEVGVVGLGVLADGLRKPIGVDGPIVGAADWQDISFGSLGSEGQERAIQALGATPAEVIGPYREEAIADDAIQGFEFSLFFYRNPMWVGLAPYVTANVNLWPQMDVLIADPARLEELTNEQRGWLQQAADAAASRSAALADTDAQSIKIVCDTGARFAEASEADLAALQEAFSPVYAALGQDPETKAFIEQIQALKESATPEALTIPAGCTGKAPELAAGKGSAPAYLNGIYRYTITKEDVIEHDMGDPADYPSTNTVTLDDGRFSLRGVGPLGHGGFSGNYTVEKNRITFEVPEYGETTIWTFFVDDHGDLHLTPVLPMDPGTAFEFSVHPWTRIR